MLGDRRPAAIAVALVLAVVTLLLIGWGLGELARSLAQTTDLDSVRDLASERTGALTAAAHTLSTIGSGYVVFTLTAVVCAGLWYRGRVRATLALAVTTAGAVLLSSVDKVLVDRPRPPVHHLEHVASASFPSGHSTQASAFYGALLLIFLCHRPGRLRALPAAAATIGLVLGIALSRVYLGVHYPSDVAGGLLLGAGWSTIACSLLLGRDPGEDPPGVGARARR
jgi:membrane-associated phospholipid phosphatase